MPPALSVLVCSLASRRETRKGLVDTLIRQTQQHNAELLMLEDDGEMPSGAKRNALLATARGDYVAFVDDDDQVSSNYVTALIEATRAGVDVVTFDMMRHAATRREVHTFGLRFKDHDRQADGKRRMTVNHLCAWRRDLATRVGFMPHLGYNDDVFWYTPLVASGLPKTERHVSEILYHYYWHPETTQNQSRRTIAATHRWAAGGVDAFWYGSEIVLAAVGRNASDYQALQQWAPSTALTLKRVIDHTGASKYVPPGILKWFCTVHAV